MTKLILKALRIGVVIAFAHTVAHNFPGRSVGYAHPELRRRGDQGRFTASTLRFSNSHFRVVYPQSIDTEQVERVLNILESGRTEILRRVPAAYNFVKQLIRVLGENKAWKRLADRGYSVKSAVHPALIT